MSDLIDFLRARVDDDERDAPNWHHLYRCEYAPSDGAEPCSCGIPAWALREVEAKRRILDLHSVDHECSTIRRGTDWDGAPYEEINNCTWVVDEDCSTVRLLALPYSDHPDYREEWTP